ncbi:TPA: hypothetical protein ACN35C_004723 [Vibrio parahaemolyticus]
MYYKNKEGKTISLNYYNKTNINDLILETGLPLTTVFNNDYDLLKIAAKDQNLPAATLAILNQDKACPQDEILPQLEKAFGQFEKMIKKGDLKPITAEAFHRSIGNDLRLESEKIDVIDAYDTVERALGRDYLGGSVIVSNMKTGEISTLSEEDNPAKDIFDIKDDKLAKAINKKLLEAARKIEGLSNPLPFKMKVNGLELECGVCNTHSFVKKASYSIGMDFHEVSDEYAETEYRVRKSVGIDNEGRPSELEIDFAKVMIERAHHSVYAENFSKHRNGQDYQAKFSALREKEQAYILEHSEQKQEKKQSNRKKNRM